MKKGFVILLIIVILLGIIFVIKNKKEDSGAKTETIVGCYVAKIDKNVYTLNIKSDEGSVVSGTMHYDNFQFDDSSGTFNGNFINDILIGDYAFNAEGMDSIRQLIWKRSGSNFIQGSGDYKTDGKREVFVDQKSVTWDPNRTFIKTPCE